MDIKEIIAYLDGLIKNDNELSNEDKMALAEANRLLLEAEKQTESRIKKEWIWEALKLIATILGRWL